MPRFCLICALVVSFLPTWSVASSRPGERPSPPPLTSVKDLLDEMPPPSSINIRGIVTYVGKEIVVQDQTGSVAVDPPPSLNAALGDEVQITGRLERRPGLPIIRDAHVHVLWAGSTPLPLAIVPDEAATGAYNGILVSTEGRLVKVVSDEGAHLRLTLDGGSQLFTCALDADTIPQSQIPEVGSTVRCTGVLAVEQRVVVVDTGTFVILLRDRQDIHILSDAPWWNSRHLVILVLLLLVRAWIGYRIHLRNLRARMNMIVEERSRIAREIHDTLAQGFAGIALQLQSLDASMKKGSSISDEHLRMALQMVRRSRAEAHRSIATLRTLHSGHNLSTMAERLLKQLIQASPLQLTIEEHGTARPCPDEVSTQILRITQEAVANIVEHAKAKSILLRFEYGHDDFVLLVIDDGCGFDPEHAGSLDDGYFGIGGMRERAMQISGELSITSTPHGTTLRLRVPMRPHHSFFERLLFHARRARQPFARQSKVNTAV